MVSMDKTFRFYNSPFLEFCQVHAVHPMCREVPLSIFMELEGEELIKVWSSLDVCKTFVKYKLALLSIKWRTLLTQSCWLEP